jgi:hypothetical protein
MPSNRHDHQWYLGNDLQHGACFMNFKLRLQIEIKIAHLYVKVDVSEEHGTSIFRTKVNMPKLTLKGFLALKCISIFLRKKRIQFYVDFETVRTAKPLGA